jgi:dehydrogenase/reductase SDR family protein 1
VIIVTGGSRGVGKGIVLGLAEQGAIIYVTGRTVTPGTGSWPGSLSETAEEAAALGGQCIAVPCDHSDDTAVASLFRRVTDEQGRLDVLVNNVFATPDGGMPRSEPFWEQPIGLWDRLHRVGLRSHYVASVFAAPIMVAQRRGLIVTISSIGAARFHFNVAYGAAKAAANKLAADMAEDLRPYGVASVALWPGFTRTEAVLAQAEQWNLGTFPTMSPQLTGRAVAALAGDREIMTKTGQTLIVAALAKEYGFTDVDGSRPPIPAYARR